MDLEVFIIPSARREVELRDENVAGYLAAFARLDVRTFRSTSRQRMDQGSRTQRRRDEVISRDEMVDLLSLCTRRDASDARGAVKTPTRPKHARADRDAIIPSFFSFLVLLGRGPLIRGLLSFGGPRVAAPPSCKGPPRL